MVAVALLVPLVATTHGSALTPDSLVYIGTARNFIRGNGFTEPGGKPLTIFPWGYPLLLASGAWAGIDPVPVSKVIGVAAFVASVAVLGWLLLRLTESTGAAIIGMLLFITSNPFFVLYTVALSDGPFMLLLLIGVALLVEGLHRSNTAIGAAGALAVGLTTAMRYPGLAFVAVTPLLPLLQRRQGLGRRLLQCAIYAVAAATPFLIVSLRNRLVAGNSTSRTLGFHPLRLLHLRDVTRGLSEFCAPRLYPFAVRLAISLLVGGFVLWLLRPVVARLWANRKDVLSSLEGIASTISLLFALAYVGLIVTAFILFHGSARVETRYLMPIVVFALLMVAPSCWRYPSWRAGDERRRVALLGVAGFLALQAVGVAAVLADRHRDGEEYASKSWQESALITHLRAHHEGRPLYANDYGAVIFFLGRTATQLPSKFHPDTSLENADYRSQLLEMGKATARGDAWIVMLHSGEWDYMPTTPEIRELPGVSPILSDERGTVYGAR